MHAQGGSCWIEVRRDGKQLIGRKLAHSTAVKTGLGESPLKGGSPEE
jgi:hypothetical protein